MADLIAALDEGHLGAAYLDVFDPEPLPADHPAWRHPRITVTSHVAGLPRGAPARARWSRLSPPMSAAIPGRTSTTPIAAIEVSPSTTG